MGDKGTEDRGKGDSVDLPLSAGFPRKLLESSFPRGTQVMVSAGSVHSAH